MMPEKALWPQALDWGLHDFCLQGAMGGAGFRAIIENSYGGATNAEEWIRLAQFVNYDTYRAMFEAQSKYRMGVLLWMSHSCWPSFVWQTYDYFFEPTAAYYGCKKGSEPLHIQWNSAERNHRGGELQRRQSHWAQGVGRNPQHGWKANGPENCSARQRRRLDDVTCIDMKYPRDCLRFTSCAWRSHAVQKHSPRISICAVCSRMIFAPFASCPQPSWMHDKPRSRRAIAGRLSTKLQNTGRVACLDGARKSGAREDRRSHPARDLLRQLHRADARRNSHDCHRGERSRHTRGETNDRAGLRGFTKVVCGYDEL